MTGFYLDLLLDAKSLSVSLPNPVKADEVAVVLFTLPEVSVSHVQLLSNFVVRQAFGKQVLLTAPGNGAYEPKNLQYRPVLPDELRDLTFTICDQNGDQIQLSDGKVAIVLHFS